MTRERAIQIIRENAVWDSVVTSHPSLESNIVDALMQSVAEERSACAKLALEEYEAGKQNAWFDYCRAANNIHARICSRELD